jgi:hypothetical protein
MVAERRMRCPCRNTVRRPAGGRWSWWPRCPDACRALVALSASSVSIDASGVRCPVSGVRCDRPVSAHAMSTRPVSNVRVWTCPGVDVRRPASVSAPSASASAVSAPVTSWSASVRWAATQPAGARVWPPCRIHEPLGHLPEPELGLRAGAGRAGPAATSSWTWPSSWEALGQRARFDRLAGQGHAG